MDLNVSNIIEVDPKLSSVQVGMDVHAIGHPSGGSYCTYTKGVVSQYNQNYEWDYEQKSFHKADVIQHKHQLIQVILVGHLLAIKVKLLVLIPFL